MIKLFNLSYKIILNEIWEEEIIILIKKPHFQFNFYLNEN